MSALTLAIGVIVNLAMASFFYRFCGHRGRDFGLLAIGCLISVLFNSQTGLIGVAIALAFWWWTGGGGRGRKVARRLGDKGKALVRALVDQLSPAPQPSGAGA